MSALTKIYLTIGVILMNTLSSYAAVHAPEFPPNHIWINSPPMTMAQLKGKVVLIDIWDYTCVNCIRTLPYIQEWHRRYAPYGLTVIGVHTPEFDFARQKDNVATAVKSFKLTYPIVLDNEYKIWDSYANRYWPRKYLINQDGIIVFDHAGEGGYIETEKKIQELLKKNQPGLKLPAPYIHPGPPESGGLCYPTTPETYAGYLRGKLVNPGGYQAGKVAAYTDPKGYTPYGHLYLQGTWESHAEGLRHGRKSNLTEDYVALPYRAISVNAVIKPAREKPYRVYVRQDDQWVLKEDRGKDLRVDEKGRTYLLIEDSRMYQIIKNKSYGQYVLKLSSDSESFDLYAFTFGSCLISDGKP